MAKTLKHPKTSYKKCKRAQISERDKRNRKSKNYLDLSSDEEFNEYNK